MQSELLLPLTNSWHAVCLEKGQILLLSSEDMKCAFYLFALPPAWWKWLCFSKPVTRAQAGLAGNPLEKVLVCLTVVPMGWTSATGLIQHAHRALCRLAGFPSACEIRRDRPLRQFWLDHGDGRGQVAFKSDWLYYLWQIYLDNLDILEVASEEDLRHWVQTTSEAVQDMRKVYDAKGVQRSARYQKTKSSARTL